MGLGGRCNFVLLAYSQKATLFESVCVSVLAPALKSLKWAPAALEIMDKMTLKMAHLPSHAQPLLWKICLHSCIPSVFEKLVRDTLRDHALSLLVFTFGQLYKLYLETGSDRLNASGTLLVAFEDLVHSHFSTLKLPRSREAVMLSLKTNNNR